jgi:ABC-2 type transport system ATP-binding protein
VVGESLRITVGPAAGGEIEVEEELLIGRTVGGRGSLGEDPELSRQHARFSRSSQGQLQVEDLGSLNGTFVNDRRITAVELLGPGDVVRLGSSELEVSSPLSQAQPTRAAEARPAPGGRPAALRVTAGPAAGQLVEIAGDELLIGRTADEEGRLGDDPELSRRHASILHTADGRLQVEDLGSTNGTWINGTRIVGTQALEPGDVLELGGTKLEVLGAVIEVGQTTAVRARPDVVAVPPPTPAAPSNGIEVENLVREFKGKGRAVDGVSFTVEPGEVYGFLGPNGAGKSTTVHMLTTLLAPTGGTARVAGYDIVKQGAEVRSAIGVALQEAALDPNLNAWEHMALQTALQGVPKAERKKRAEELIERVSLTDAADRAVAGYSGGMKRRLDLALSLAHRPRLVFLDEPTTGLDPKSRTDLWDEVARLARDEGVTVFLTTQYLEEADMLARRVGIIEGGKLVAEGTPDELKADIGRPTVEAVPYDEHDRGAVAKVLRRFGEASAAAHKGVAVRLKHGVDDLADIVRALDSEGLKIANLSLHAPTLDDVFLAKTGRSLEESVEETDLALTASRAQISLPGQPIIRPE